MRSVFTPSSIRLYGLSLSVCIGILFWALGGTWAAESYLSAVDRPAVTVERPQQRVLLDIARAGDRLVAVGERGLIILSDDGGENWRQAAVPVSVTLTAITFASPEKGWATGHWGVVLHTQDGGSTWTRQLEGRQAAAIELKAAEVQAQENGSTDEQPDQRLQLAQLLVNEGPDKPFLALHFLDDRTGFIIGAYGLIFRTDDGGNSWQSLIGQIDNPGGFHLYVIDGNRQELWIAGEKGFIAVSRDGGMTFAKADIDAPSKASFFAGRMVKPGIFVAAGLQGNAFRTIDGGLSFQPIQLPAPVSINAVATLDGQSIVFLSQSGQLLRSTDYGQTLQPIEAPAMPPPAALVRTSPANLLAVGMGGVIRIPFSNTLSSNENGAHR